MAQVAQVKRVFAGSNTGVGFHSFFHHIAGPEIEHVYVIKGGPGTGKSTLMSYMAEKSISRGFPLSCITAPPILSPWMDCDPR